MHTLRIVGVVAVLAVVLLCSIAVYMTFDRYSHSSDTPVDFVITMAPVWLGAIVGARTLLDPAERPDDPGRR